MRTIILTCAGLLTLCAISAHAAPLPPQRPTHPSIVISPPIELVAQGCGYGQRRTYWQDQWGRWHWGRCVPKTWGSLPRQQFLQ
jgi:hypothetical protein